jgi:hypothetical protein
MSDLMRRTRPRDLAIVLIAVAAIGYAWLRISYDSMPPLSYFVPVPVAALGAVELVLARRVRAAIRHDPQARPMAAIAVARCVALGKASSLVGSGLVGAALALLGRVLPNAGTVRVEGNDARVAALLVAAGALIGVAGLLLERAGIDPGRDARPPIDGAN